MIPKSKVARSALTIFVVLSVLVSAIVALATAYGRTWSVRVYEPQLRQNIRAFAAKDDFGRMERMALSVLDVTPEYASAIREETAPFRNVLPELSARLDRDLAPARGAARP